ncbi:MAG TPA: ROK family protein [bacterium]|nr:ROK family protein [bacterium]HPN42244.1 ROK family protein [bacterium]
MKYDQDKRIVMTLDAGGTNFVFSAIQGNHEIVKPITLPSNANDLEACLETIVTGFKRIKEGITGEPVAISFAFPGPSDYPNGIIGDLANLPAFRGGVALGPMLQNIFSIPVYINNDGDLFVYGEAIAGLLPAINAELQQAGSPKQYKNLFGVTLGTGFGGGIVRDGNLFIGDNAAAGEIWVMRNKVNPKSFAEEGASIRAVKGAYARVAGIAFDKSPEPKEIFEIGSGLKPGNQPAALEAFRELGEVVGDALANATTLIDGLVVIGGGLAGAFSLFMPAIIAEMNGVVETYKGALVNRMESRAFNLEDVDDKAAFLRGEVHEITVPRSGKKILYDPLKRVGVGISRLGTSKAVSVGAYAFALHELDSK